MILDAWFWTGLVIGAVSFVVCVVMTAIRRHPADASIPVSYTHLTLPTICSV